MGKTLAVGYMNEIERYAAYDTFHDFTEEVTWSCRKGEESDSTVIRKIEFKCDPPQCSICKENCLTHKQNVVSLSCHKSHIFHRRCIGPIVRSSNNKCPMCRQHFS